MNPAWDSLMREYEGHPSVLIGDVDCTVHKDLCSRFGVSGYPTIKYFTAETGEEGKPYQSGRDLASLKKFTEENLSAKCTVDDTEGCSEKETAYMTKMQGKSAEDIAKQLAAAQADPAYPQRLNDHRAGVRAIATWEDD